MNNSVGIVMKGVLSQSIISSKGHVHSLYLLRKGEIMGESFYFCGGKNNISTLVKEDAKVSFLLKDELENELKNNPDGYRYFIHSLTRKYRIVTLQLTCNLFNDSLGKIADALLRLSSCAEIDSLGRINLNMKFSHQELANIIGCSRITVTNCLNKLLKEKIISYENKNIIINKPEDLKKYIDLIVD
jgi:CRP/FNR family cyclic AMP-dependent transcriptional regulator